MPASPWPMPGVSTITRSWPAARQAATTSSMRSGTSAPERPGGERAHEHARVVDRVHADAVAQQRAAGPAPGGVDGEHGDAELVLVVEAQAADQLVGERRLARPAGAGDAEHGDGPPAGGRAQVVEQVAAQRAALDGGDRAGQGAGVAGEHVVDGVGGVDGQVDVAGRDDRVDHGGEAEALAVLGREDAGHAVGVELGDLVGDDDAAAAAEHLDVGAALGPEPVDQVAEVLEVAALVGADRHALHVLLDRGPDDLVDRAVVAQVDDLGALGLQDAPHDVDGGVVPVEQAGGGDEADGVDRTVQDRRPAHRARACSPMTSHDAKD